MVGWDDLVGSGQNDRALLSILEDNLANNLDIEESVESYMASLNPNLNSMANLKYFSDEDL